MFDFDKQLKILPNKPGVYIMKNSLGEIIYIGKAKILKNRVRQYFQNSKNHSVKVRAMVKHISEFEYVVTDSEIEALLLECNLIKKYTPKYNIALKDDKAYPFIKITTKEEFPRVFVTKRFEKDGNRYFGPYANSLAVHETIDLIKKLFQLRTCKRGIGKDIKFTRPCLNYHIKRCSAPCAGYINSEDYKNMINEIINILSGKDNNLISNLNKNMQQASENLEFEKAAKLRDKISSIKYIIEKQKIYMVKENDEDFINIYSDNKDTCVQIFFLRQGKIVDRENFIFENKTKDNLKEVLEEFVISFYGGATQIPKDIYVSEIENKELLEEFLTIKRGSKVNIKTPKIGSKKKLLDMVKNNAKITLEKFKEKILKDKEINKACIAELANILNLDILPNRIESYDISNIQGVYSVGTMVVFEYGKPKKSDYRKFRIKNVIGPNDYDSIREIIERRFINGLEEIKLIQEQKINFSKGKFSKFPDLIMIDGGKGQINSVLDVLNRLNINIPVCGMVKDDKHKTRGIIYNGEELFIKKNTNLMHMITRIQDEVHRFSINYHRQLRSKKTLHSILDDIPKIGGKRKKDLLDSFGSVDKIKNSNLKELLEIPSINKECAENIINFFAKVK